MTPQIASHGNEEGALESTTNQTVCFFFFLCIQHYSTINESFAELICACHLHWELCSTLEKYLRRHRADSTRMTQATFQLGCELLLSVFSKMEKLRTLLRDHLYHVSRYKIFQEKDR